MLLFRLAISVSGYALDAACRDGSSVPQGYQAIILGAPFKHNGSITAINAVVSFDPSNFPHAIYLQVWRPTGPSAFTVVSEQYFFADPAATYPQPSPTELNFPAQFKNTPPIQLSFLPNDVLGYYVITNGALIADIGRAFFLSPLLINSSQLRPSSINVYTSNSSGPLQNISISGSPAYTSVHPLITITYNISPSPNMGVVQSSAITVLGACPAVSSIVASSDASSPQLVATPTASQLVATPTASQLVATPTASQLVATPTASLMVTMPTSSVSLAIVVYTSVGVVTATLALLLLSLLAVAAVNANRSRMQRRNMATDIAMVAIATSENAAYWSTTNQNSGGAASINVQINTAYASVKF